MVSSARRFEDLLAWQKARSLAAAIYRVTRKRDLARDFGLAGQLQRAAASIMPNLAEGFERNSRAEFHYFVSTAKGSCAEVRSLLYLAGDAGYLDPGEFEQLLQQAEEVGRLIGGLRVSIERRGSAGFPSEKVTSPTKQAPHSAPSTRDLQSEKLTAPPPTPRHPALGTRHSAPSGSAPSGSALLSHDHP